MNGLSSNCFLHMLDVLPTYISNLLMGAFISFREIDIFKMILILGDIVLFENALTIRLGIVLNV